MTRIRHKVRLELGDVDVEGAVEAERRRQGRDHLRQQAVEVRVRRPLDVQVPAADIVKGFVIYLVRDVGVLQERVHAEHGVVRLDARRGDLRARPDGERDLRLLAVVDRQALEEKAAETRACAATARVKHHEALEARAVVSELAEAVQHQIHDLLANPIFKEPLVADVFILNSRTTNSYYLPMMLWMLSASKLFHVLSN